MCHEYPDFAQYDWSMHALPHQCPPAGDWSTWIIMGGRGAGKTRAGAEWVRSIVSEKTGPDPACGDEMPSHIQAFSIGLVARSYGDAREVMIDGPSGICAVCAPGNRPVYESSRRRLVWAQGAKAYAFSAEDPEGIRGFQFDAAWCDELCKWKYPERTWTNLQLALRSGKRPRQLVTTTPRPMKILKKLLAAKGTSVSRATTYDNRKNLPDAFFREIASVYENSALGRQELMGEIIEDAEGALWTWKMIESARVSSAPEMERMVVSVDPPVTTGNHADECGIIVAGRAGREVESAAYVIADRSAKGLSPYQWAERVIKTYHIYKADRIIMEVNQGGDMAHTIIKQIDASAPVKNVRASRGKIIRAEPVAALYEQNRVRHVGAFPELEDQMTSYTGNRSGESPDRLDALVWAVSELLLGSRIPRPAIREVS